MSMCKLKSSRLARKGKKRDREKYNKDGTSKGAYIVAYSTHERVRDHGIIRTQTSRSKYKRPKSRT